jgi:hypothetical protein
MANKQKIHYGKICQNYIYGMAKYTKINVMEKIDKPTQQFFSYIMARTGERIVMSKRHPFSTVSCFRRFVSRDKITHYFDRFICQRLYYDAEFA